MDELGVTITFVERYMKSRQFAAEMERSYLKDRGIFLFYVEYSNKHNVIIHKYRIK